jgi:hypothetical protein
MIHCRSDVLYVVGVNYDPMEGHLEVCCACFTVVAYSIA